MSVRVIEVPSDRGLAIAGTRAGPAAIIKEGLLTQITQLLDREASSTVCSVGEQENSLQSITETCQNLYRDVTNCLNEGVFPLTLGGDHSIAVGSLSASSNWCHAKGKKLGVLWFDAHADINTPTSSPSGNIHGMPVASLLGHGHADLLSIGSERVKIAPQQIALIGLRALDPGEKNLLKQLGVHCYTMRDIDHLGMPAIMEDAWQKVGALSDHVHMSFDIDGLDPSVAPAVTVPELGGMSFRELRYAFEHIARSNKLISADFVELNPDFDVNNQTAQVAISLILSILGYKLL